MLIPDRNAVFQCKGVLLLMILDILKSRTDAAHRITKARLREAIGEIYGFEPARNTVDAKLTDLMLAGFPIVQDRAGGVYYDGCELSDGQLRYLADSVLYSDFVTQNAAAEIIEALAALGSLEFQKYIRKQKICAEKTRKNTQQSIFLVIEEIQSAIQKKQQISCNYLTYHADLTTECVYPEDITVSPYEMIYKNGRYYLLGALNGSDAMLTWRVDRLCRVQILETKRRDIPMLKEISASGGLSAYADTQPDLCGGVIESFKIQCAKNAIDEIVDVFGRRFSIAPEQAENYDDETVILTVRATRESMKSWAFMHAGSMVVISPEDFRKEISDSLHQAQKLYNRTGKPLRIRVLIADSLAEKVRFTKKAGMRWISYHGRGRIREKETVDLTQLLQIPDLVSLSLLHCKPENTECLKQLSLLRRLILVDCEFDGRVLLELTGIQELRTDQPLFAAGMCQAVQPERLALIGEAIRDISFLAQASSVRWLVLLHCIKLTDCSALQNADQIETIEISDCDQLTDLTFLLHMTGLKKVRLYCPLADRKHLELMQKQLTEKGVLTDLHFSGKQIEQTD